MVERFLDRLDLKSLTNADLEADIALHPNKAIAFVLGDRFGKIKEGTIITPPPIPINPLKAPAKAPKSI